MTDKPARRQPRQARGASTASAAELGRDRLLYAALALFAEQGVEAVPMRLVNREAGARNNSALHYHFGGKQGLVEALVGFIQDWFEAHREGALQALESRARDEPITVREVLAAFLLPYRVLLENEPWGSDAVRFLGRMEFEADPATREVLNRYAVPAMRRVRALLVRALPELPRRLMQQRLAHCLSSIILGLADRRSLKNSYVGDAAPRDLDALIALYVDYHAAALAAPVAD
jgi:AcrR family transcriptional regulator